jgi:hypothetical protein
MNTYYEYALGYYDGRAEGVYNNPYEDREMRHAYKLGYDKGVADYCHYELEEHDFIDHEMECGK